MSRECRRDIEGQRVVMSESKACLTGDLGYDEARGIWNGDIEGTSHWSPTVQLGHDVAMRQGE